MTIWWNSLDLFQKAMFVIATPATIIMIVFMALMIIGFDADESFESLEDFEDMDENYHDDSGQKIFTLKGILSSLSVGGWTALELAFYFYDFWACLFGIVTGIIAAILVTWMIYLFKRTNPDELLDFQKAVGKTADVFIMVPQSRSGKGMVTFTFQETPVEVDAVTDEAEDLLPRTRVTVVGLVDDNTMLIEKQR